MRRKRTSREAMRSWVSRFERSGLSPAAFCRRHGFPAQRLSYWRRVVGAAVPQERVSLAPVQVVGLAEAVVQGSVEIHLPSGERVIVRADVPAELLRETLSALRATC